MFIPIWPFSLSFELNFHAKISALRGLLWAHFGSNLPQKEFQNIFADLCQNFQNFSNLQTFAGRQIFQPIFTDLLEFEIFVSIGEPFVPISKPFVLIDDNRNIFVPI